MASRSHDSANLKFGPFEIDALAGRLLKSGIPIKLQPQPFRVLLLLLQNPGHVISREEIRRHLWGVSTFVDFERGINLSINQIRAALCDNAEKPRYIETLPRVGYRFIAKLEPSNGASAHTADKPPRSAIHVVVPIERATSVTSGKSVWWRRGALYGLPVLLAMLAAASVFLYIRRPPPLTEKDALVLADFTNRTGDPIFDEILKEALAIELDQSPFLNIFPENGVRETLRYMSRSPDEKITPEIAREICARRGIKAMLTGSISKLGRNYAIALEARNCQTGEALAQQRVESEGKEHVLRELSRAASNLRAQLGESVKSLQKFSAPLEQATTNSLEALQAYTLGRQRQSQGADVWDVVTYFKRATELDPNFAMANAALGDLYSGGVAMSKDDLSTEYLTRAFNLRDSVSEREKLYLAALYYEDAARELDKAVESYELWKWTYPRDAQPYSDLAGVFNELGRYQNAVDNAKQAIFLRPDHNFAYQRLATAYFSLNRWSEAKAICEDSVAKKLDGPNTHWRLYTIAFIEDDSSAMERELEWAKKRGDTTRPMFYHALQAGYWGKLKQSTVLFEQTVQDRRAAHDSDGAALATVQLAVINAILGYGKLAREQALASEPDLRTDKELVALALALTGNSARAQQQLAAVEKRFPQDTRLHNLRAPSVQAIIELSRNHAKQALELLKSAVPYELGTDSSGWGLLPIYLRGQAHLQLRAGNEAAIEFQRILDHRGVAPFSPLHALALLGLARSHALGHDRTKSLSEYREFLEVWRDADPEIPILVRAKAEYRRLSYARLNAVRAARGMAAAAITCS